MSDSCVTSNVSFSNNVFQSYISLVHQNVLLCGNGLKLNKPKFCHLVLDRQSLPSQKIFSIWNIVMNGNITQDDKLLHLKPVFKIIPFIDRV